jgi:hypothetical protein
MTRKVNWKNVSIVLMVSIFGISIGFIDRVVNHIGPLETIITHIAKFGTTEIPPQAAWYNTTTTLASSANSGFNLFGLILIVMAAVCVMTTLMYTARCAA